jgi:hypothetical protein
VNVDVENVTLQVSVSGHGIPQEKLGRFRQVQKPTRLFSFFAEIAHD